MSEQASAGSRSHQPVGESGPIVVEEFEKRSDLVELRAHGHDVLSGVDGDEAQIHEFREVVVMHRALLNPRTASG